MFTAPLTSGYPPYYCRPREVVGEERKHVNGRAIAGYDAGRGSKGYDAPVQGGV